MDRLQVALRIADRRLTQTAGAQILGISDRQMRRICRRFAQEGAAGLGSKRRGRSNRRLPVELRKDALALIGARYADFGPTLAQEKLLEQLEHEHLDDIFTWQEERRVTAQLTVHHKRTMCLLEPTEEAKAAAKKHVTFVEYEDGGVSIRFEGTALAARPFHKDGGVTQGSIVENKLLSGALAEI